VVLNDFSDDEVQKLLGEFGVQIGPVRQIFEPRDLVRFAGGIGRGKVVCSLEFPHSLRVLDKDRIQTVDGGAVVFEDFGGLGNGVGH